MRFPLLCSARGRPQDCRSQKCGHFTDSRQQRWRAEVSGFLRIVFTGELNVNLISLTSPQPMMGGHPPSSLTDSSRRSSSTNKGHVRFLDIGPERDSSESETENTVMEDETITSEKFLLLIDQLSVDQKRHLSIKDIGIILERLSSKILDVERLDRESESDDCFNWTIKATIRGDALRELGVIYNGNYYAISEHPGYKEENEENCDEEQEEEEDEDRL